MKKTSRGLVYAAFSAITLLYLLEIVIAISHIAAGRPEPQPVVAELVVGVLTFTFPLVGFLILTRQPGHAIGWILLSIGFAWTATGGVSEYAINALVTNPGLPRGALAAALTSWGWVPPVGLMGTFLILLFPNGRLPSPRWRIVAWLSAFAMVGSSLSIMFSPRDLAEEGFPGVRNPLSIPGLTGFFEVLQLCVPLIAVCVLASAVSLVLRFRKSRGVERLQLKWLTIAAAIVAGLLGVAMAASVSQPWGQPTTSAWIDFIQKLAVVSFFLIPLSIGIAILRYRLYDIDLVINKTVVYAGLAGFITAVYVGVVVGIGTLVGAGDKPNLALSLLATALVAVAFQPVRERVQRFANKLVYGERVTPYEAITGFSNRMAESLSLESVLPQMAEAAAKGVGGIRSRVKLILPGGGERVVDWPGDSTGNSFDQTLAVVHQGEQMGEISVSKSAEEQINRNEVKLLSDLASQAGLAMRNLRLTAELQQKLVELQASRQRIVKAQDEERRRMERDIHDGAQQQLVSMSVKLGLVGNLLSRDVQRASTILDELKTEASEAVETLRDLARGLFPEILTDQGLKSALLAHIAKMDLNARVEGEIGRFDLEVEANVYFCIREALQNASKHAPAAEVLITLSAQDGQLAFSVKDEGPGFDAGSIRMGSGLQNMADRVEALGGTFEINSAPGKGTSINGRISAAPAEQQVS